MGWLGGFRRSVSAACAAPEALQRDFLPGALAVQDTPPSPAGRWLLWLLLILFAAGLLWAVLGEVDVVVTAPGKIIPSGQVKRVQAPEAAVVAVIHVRDGQRVEKGQPLISLDPTVADADGLRVAEQLRNAGRELAWRELLERWLADPNRTQAESDGSPGDGNAAELRVAVILQQRQTEIMARILGLDKDVEANASERQSVQAELERARARLEIVRERVASHAALLKKQYGAKVQYLEMLERQIDLEKSLPVFRAREQQLQLAAQSLAAKRLLAVSEIRGRNLLEIERLEAERALLEQDSRKALQRTGRQILRAPVTGTVQELAVHTIGAVITPAQPLLKVVPEAAVLEVNALVQNKDIGFVGAGQVAQVKVDSFNFTKYGLIQARILGISQDAIEDKKMGWVFTARLQLSASHMLVAGKPVQLSPGMSVSAEIKTGKRRLIEFFLSPLLRYKQESIRER